MERVTFRLYAVSSTLHNVKSVNVCILLEDLKWLEYQTMLTSQKIRWAPLFPNIMIWEVKVSQ